MKSSMFKREIKTPVPHASQQGSAKDVPMVISPVLSKKFRRVCGVSSSGVVGCCLLLVALLASSPLHAQQGGSALGMPNDLDSPLPVQQPTPKVSMPSDEEMGLTPDNPNATSVHVIVPPEDNATGGATYDLAKTVITALERNPRLQSAKSAWDAARQGRNSKVSAFFPTLSGSYTYTYTDWPKVKGEAPTQSNTDYTLAFSVKQNLFTGWKTLNEYRKARLQVEQAGTNFTNEELSLLLTVQENFLNLLGAQENVRSAQDSVTRLRSQLQVTQAFYDVGLRPRLDVLQAEVDLGDAEDTLLQAQNAVDTQRARLATLMDLELDDPLVYTGELRYMPFNLSLEACLTEAYRNRPDLQIYQRAIEIGRKDAHIAGSVMLPQVAATVDWYQSGNHPDLHGDTVQSALTKYDTYAFTIGVNWEIFDFGENYFNWRQAQELVKQFEADYANQFLEATFDVKSRHLSIAETAKRIKVARQSLGAAKESYRMAVARYQAQVGTSTDVLDAQSRLTNAEAQTTQALVDHQVALANLYVAIGRKNITLDVGDLPAPVMGKPKTTVPVPASGTSSGAQPAKSGASAKKAKPAS
ncbi:TolC family protein [Megalodesulfovibrio paquesii]